MIMMIVFGLAVLVLGFVLGMAVTTIGLGKGLAKIGLDLEELLDLIEKVQEREKEETNKDS